MPRISDDDHEAKTKTLCSCRHQEEEAMRLTLPQERKPLQITGGRVAPIPAVFHLPTAESNKNLFTVFFIYIRITVKRKKGKTFFLNSETKWLSSHKMVPQSPHVLKEGVGNPEQPDNNYMGRGGQ